MHRYALHSSPAMTCYADFLALGCCLRKLLL